MRSAAKTVVLGFAAACAVALASACKPRAEPEVAPERARPQLAPTQRPLAPPNANVLQEATPAAVLERMRARMRLSPDLRFLTALPRVDRLAGAKQVAAVATRFDSGRWHVRIGSEDIGTMPELAGFADQYALLKDRATQVWKQSGEAVAAATIAADDATFAAEHPLATLHEIDRSWAQGRHSADDATRAARAYVVLCLGVVDDLDVADALFAQALAATAFAEVVSGRDPVREKAIIARVMGYAGSASAIAAALPDGDVVRSFVDRKVDAVVASSKEHKDDLFTMQLALDALSGRAQTRDVESFMAQAPDALKGSFPALATRISGSWRTGAEWRMAFSALIAMREAANQPVAVPPELRFAGAGLRENADVSVVAAALQVPYEQVLPQGERLIAAIAGGESGVWLPADTRAAYYKAQFFSALDALVRFYVDRLNSPEDAKEVVAMLGSGQGALATQFERFAKDIIAAERRTLALDVLVKDIRELGVLGIGAIDRLWEPLREQGAYSAVQQQGAAAIVERCDSRVSCRALLSDVAYYSLNDLVSDDLLRRSVIDEAPQIYPGLRLRHLRMDRDRAGFLALIREPIFSPNVRAWHLGYRPGWLEAADVRSAFDGLLREAPTNFGVREHYARWLIDQKDYTRAIAVLDEWLAQKKSDHVLDPLLARTMRARALQFSGHVPEAWTEIEPLLPSMYGPTMMRAAYIKFAAGDADAAIALARKRLERYSNTDSVGLLAEMLWKAGKNDDAAKLIESWSNRLTILDWTNPIADAFAEAYRDKPPEQGAQAYAELLAKQVDPQGVRLMIRTSKLPAELAFRAFSQVRGSGYTRHWDAARSYQMLKSWKGEADARAWIEKALPSDRDPLSQHGYTEDAYELVWNVVADPKPDHASGSFIWLMRVAGYLRSPAPGADWKARIDQYYAQHRESLRDRMALHLLGQVDQKSVWAAVKEGDDRPESTWIFGFKAQLDGDIAQAVDWYRATLEGGRANSGEVQWSSNALERLRDSDESIAMLSKEAKPQKPAAD